MSKTPRWYRFDCSRNDPFFQPPVNHVQSQFKKFCVDRIEMNRMQNKNIVNLSDKLFRLYKETRVKRIPSFHISNTDLPEARRVTSSAHQKRRPHSVKPIKVTETKPGLDSLLKVNRMTISRRNSNQCDEMHYSYEAIILQDS